MIDLSKNNRIGKMISIVSFLFLLIILLTILITPPSKGYELSIYDAYPWYLWFFIAGTTLLVIINLYYYFVYTKNNEYLLLGILPIFFNYFILLFLPYLRGYVLYGGRSGDILVHIGISKSIIDNGYNPTNNFYPLVHILLSNLNFFGLNLEISAYLLSAIFSLLYIVFLYLLSRSIFSDKKSWLILFLFSIPLMFSYFHLSIHPSILSIFLLPLILYLFHKRLSINKNLSFTILIIILTFSIVFFHPITSIILLLIFIIFYISTFFQNRIFNKHKRVKIIYILLITLISLSTWILSFTVLKIRIRNVYENLLQPSKTTVAEQYTELITFADLNIVQLFDIIISKYGQICIYVILTCICFIFIYKKIINRNINANEINYAFQFLMSIVFVLFFIFLNLIEAEPIRISRYLILISIILCGVVFGLYLNDIKSSKRKKVFTIVIFSLVCCASVLGILNVFQSPHILEQNGQMTYMEKYGMSSFFENRNEEITVVSLQYAMGKHIIYYYGYEESQNHSLKFYRNITVPSQFGYEHNNTLRETFNDSTRKYLVTSIVNRKAHLVFPEYIRDKARQFLNEDFERLSNDHTVHKIYNNKEFEYWFVH